MHTKFVIFGQNEQLSIKWCEFPIECEATKLQSRTKRMQKLLEKALLWFHVFHFWLGLNRKIKSRFSKQIIMLAVMYLIIFSLTLRYT